MLKVYIQDCCPYCDGQAYLPAGEATDWTGETYTHMPPARCARAQASVASGSACG